MKFQQQLPTQTQNYLSPTAASSLPRKHFGSNKMASSTIFPSKNEQPISFGKKNTGLRSEDQNDMKKSLVFKGEKVRQSESSLAPTSMYSSMMMPSSGVSGGFTGSLFDDYLAKKPALGSNGYGNTLNVTNTLNTKTEENVDDFINRYKSLSCSTFSTSVPDPYSKPTSITIPPTPQPTYQKPKDSFTNPYSQLVGTSNSSASSNLKSSLIFDNYTVDDFKKRDNLYGVFDGYDKISDSKSYDAFYDKYGIRPSPYSNPSYNPNSDNTNTGTYSSSNYSYDSKPTYESKPTYDSKPSYDLNKYDSSSYNYSPTTNYNYDYSTESKPVTTNYSNSNYQIPSTAFSKKSYNDYNNYSTNNYSPISYSTSVPPNNYTYPNSYSTMNNAERISSTKEIQSTIKETDFQIGKKLGKGQFGEVFLVKHKLTGFICALKIIPKTVIKEQKVEDQLVREIKIQSYLRNNNLVALYGFFSDYANVYLLMELCTDGHVFDMLRKHRRIKEPEVKEIVRDICIGLEYIHSERIIHRDIKPENVIMQYGVAKLCDFGWSVFRGQGLRNTFCGTPLYTSPQLIRGEQYDEKIDIWAIGVLTYQLLVGKIPFKIYSEDDLSRILQDKITFPEYVDLSYDAKDFVLKLLDRSPGGTYLTMDQILAHPFLNIPKTGLPLIDATCI